MRPLVTRTLAVLRMKDRLQRDSFPRLQMSLIVAATGGFAMLASFVMLHLGLTHMAVRYPLALGMGYLFFFFLLWLWLRTKAEDWVDLADATSLVSPPGSSGGSAPGLVSGGSGDFGGGGASGSYGTAFSTSDSGVGSAVSSAAGDAVDAVTDVDEMAIPLVVILLAVGIALASLYVIYIAPMLMAEVLVDGALSYTLMRRLPEADRPHWLASALRRTALPFVVTAVFVGVVGAAMSSHAPEAVSLGDVLRHQATQ